jgi:hypothetical protein
MVLILHQIWFPTPSIHNYGWHRWVWVELNQTRIHIVEPYPSRYPHLGSFCPIPVPAQVQIKHV